MLWVALRFPCLALEALSRGRALPESERMPRAVADAGRVIACDLQAETLGVRPEMGLTAAWAFAPQLSILPYSQASERAALAGIAAWMCPFTPRVPLQPPQGILAEIEGSLRLFRGAAALLERISAGVDQMGFTVTPAMAPTARGAWWLASAGREALVPDRVALDAALAALSRRTRARLDEHAARWAELLDSQLAPDNEEYHTGLVCVAVPIRDTRGRACAAIAVHAPLSRMPLEHALAHLPALSRAAQAMASTFD